MRKPCIFGPLFEYVTGGGIGGGASPNVHPPSYSNVMAKFKWLPWW
jgi:hypothetical protein